MAIKRCRHYSRWGMVDCWVLAWGRASKSCFILPEAHTDFIFAVIGEELGLLGAVVLIGLFVLLLWRVLRIAVSCNDPFGAYLGLGIFVLLSLQIVMNLCVVTGLMPTKGLPLPLISLGGSNLLVSLMAIGTMLNIAEGGRIVTQPAALRIVIAAGGTGGHLYPGIAVARRFAARCPGTDVLFVGHHGGLEERLLPSEGFHVSDCDRAGVARAIAVGPGAGTWRSGSWHPPGTASPQACASASGGRGGRLCHGASGVGRHPATRATCAHGAKSGPRADGAELWRALLSACLPPFQRVQRICLAGP